MEKIKFNDGTSINLHQISSTDTQLTFSLYDADMNSMKEFLQNSSNTSIIKMIDFNEDTQDEKVIKGYAGYTTLASMKTEFGVITNIDYENTDDTTDSGFIEEYHDITTIILGKSNKTESDIAALKESQAEQDESIAELMFGGE